MRRCLPPALFATAALCLSLPAFAQNCPPGSWFCEDAQPPQPDVPQPAAPPAARPAERVAPAEAPPPAAAQGPREAPPPTVVYQEPPPPHVIIVSPGYRRRPPPAVVARPKPEPWHPEWGLNFRVEGLALGKAPQAQDTGGMGGVGMALRFRPVPAFAFEGGVDLLAGSDYNGFARTELPITINGIIFVNPRSRVQLYLLGGMMFSHAEVQSNTSSPLLTIGRNGYQASYDYFGGQGGMGLEFRLSKHVALDVDVLGFMRSRTDSGQTPEFVDPLTGRWTNTSAGAIGRGGLTFWW